MFAFIGITAGSYLFSKICIKKDLSILCYIFTYLFDDCRLAMVK